MDAGIKVYRNYFPIKFGWQCDCKFGKCYPVFRKLMYPGDVFKVHADLLIRYQPMLSPPMNDCVATVRFAFVPLRLVEENTELIITGSNDGHLSSETLPIMDSVFKNLDISLGNSIQKHSILDELYQIPLISFSDSNNLIEFDKDKASPAAYFAKAFARFWWDYYRDENLYTVFTDFEDMWKYVRKRLHRTDMAFEKYLKKDRYTSSLPWQLKSIVPPTIEIQSYGTMTPQYNFPLISPDNLAVNSAEVIGLNKNITEAAPGSIRAKSYDVGTGGYTVDEINAANQAFLDNLNTQQVVNVTNYGFNASQVREMMAQTRVFERLARCGSRYTEYLKANFGIAPADDTLQRAQYLGGFKTRIVTTEVIQTAAAGSNPVGTLRGHGITHGTATIKPFMAKEIGIMIGVLDIVPETIYANGVDRELTCRSRFDFFNPSFQHLSEQEVRKGEVFFYTDKDLITHELVNGQTWGFQPYAQELRTGVKHVCGDMRDSLSYWNQALILSQRPALNAAFVSASNHTASYNRPFAVSGADAVPMIVDFGGLIEAYRPLVKNGTPGLVDHN